MASANQTIGDSGGDFTVDGTERVFTLTTPGGYLSNNGVLGTDVFVNFENAAVVTTDPGGASNPKIGAGSTVPIPDWCRVFRVKTAGADGQLQVCKSAH